MIPPRSLCHPDQWVHLRFAIACNTTFDSTNASRRMINFEKMHYFGNSINMSWEELSGFNQTGRSKIYH